MKLDRILGFVTLSNMVRLRSKSEEVFLVFCRLAYARSKILVRRRDPESRHTHWTVFLFIRWNSKYLQKRLSVKVRRCDTAGTEQLLR